MTMDTYSDNWMNVNPKLDPSGEALSHVQSAVRKLGEIDWMASDAVHSLSQARKESIASFRQLHSREGAVAGVCVSVFCDLRAQGWGFRIWAGQIQAHRPVSTAETPNEEKARIRAGLLLTRDQQLTGPATRSFVERMERRRLGPQGWTSIYSLMRDGRELASGLVEAAECPEGPERDAKLRKIIDPYIHPVDDSRCEHTGLLLKEIWRYFRYIWVNSPQTVPGRNIWFLIRDRAADNHPVIGIAALSSAIVQLSARDKWIGWHGDAFLQRLNESPNDTWAQWIDRSLAEQIDGIYIEDFVDEGIVLPQDLDGPRDHTIEVLREVGIRARDQHRRFPKSSEHEADVLDDADWETKARSHLFRAKRATTLADLLETKLRLTTAGFSQPTVDNLRTVLQNREGRAAIKNLVRRVKAVHVGVSLMDVSVCGAIPPYNPILGGKLVSLLMASPEITSVYEDRYRDAPSLIASSMAGRPVRREPNLVLLGTTSLYGVGSSQYNRVRMPASSAGGSPESEIRYHELGHTLGYGSFQLSAETLRELEAFYAKAHEARLANSIFGEGVNPRLRKIRDALEAIGLPSEAILKHGDRRIVYGIPLATNFRDVLIGINSEVEPIIPAGEPAKRTADMADFWRRRWLAPRIENTRYIDQVSQHNLTYPVQHGARVQLPPESHDAPTTPTLFD